MRLVDILTPGRVTTSLHAADKEGVLHEMADLFDVRTDGLSADDVVRVFREREALASTGVGSGVAIPHGRLPGVARMQAAIGIHKMGVPFNAIDGQPVHIVIGLLGPDREASAHLKALARISRLLRDASLRSGERVPADPGRGRVGRAAGAPRVCGGGRRGTHDQARRVAPHRRLVAPTSPLLAPAPCATSSGGSADGILCVEWRR